MPNPTRIEKNCTTGEEIEIELTDAEVAELEAQAAAYAAAKEEEEAVQAAAFAAKEAAHNKLLALGLTAEEIAALSK